MIKWLPTAAALLLLSSTVSAVVFDNNDIKVSSKTTNSLHHRRANSNQLEPEPKNLSIINDRFEAIAQFTHSQLSKIPSNDDKDFDLQLAQTSLGKRPSPMPTPIKDLEQFQLNTDTPTSITDWPTFSPSSSPVTFMPTLDSPSLMPATSNPTLSPSIEPTSSMPTLSPSTRQPSSFPVTLSPSSSPTSSIGNDDDINDTVNIEKDDECTKLSLKKCKKMKDVCEVIDASCKSIGGAILNDTNYPTFYPTLTWPTYTPTEADDAILSSAPTLSTLDAEVVTSHLHVNDEDESYFPTYSPSEISTKSPAGLSSNYTSISSNSITSNHGRLCPQEFDSSIEYKAGDVVSNKRSRHCRATRCHVEYQCKPWPESAYCNLVVPGKRGSDKGWLKIGRCFDASSGGIQLNSTILEVEGKDQGNEENGEEDAANSPTGESTTGQESFHHQENEDGSLPTPSPLAHDQASSHQDNEDSDIQSGPIEETTDTEQAGTSDVDDSIRVPLPRIIADITLSSSLSEEFEQKHILSEAMTNMIYNLFGIYISPSLYDLVGLSLSVDMKQNSNQSDTESTTRIHAYFDGEAIFSMIGAPNKSDLITLLIRYFDIDEFNQRLVTSVGGRRRLSSDQEESVVVKVNSVFFALEDGSLVSAGTADWEENKLPPSSTTLERDNQLQVAFVLSALLGLACMSALIMFGIYYKRMKDEDEEELGAFPSALPSTLPSAPRIGAAPMPISSETSLNLEEGSRVSEPLDTISEVAVNTSTESGVHIQIPATPGQAVSDLSQFASDGSEVSSFSYSPSNAAVDSPAYDLGFISPPDTPMSSLDKGMTKNRMVAGSPSDLRVMSWAGDVSLGLKKNDPSKYQYHWEIYQQDSTMESV